MRVDVGQAVRANPGDVIWIRARLPKVDRPFDARLGVWSRTPGYDFAPHIQLAALGIVRDGKPQMVAPMRIMLNDNVRQKEISFVADEALEFCVRQDIDIAADPRAAVKIKRYSIGMFTFIRRVQKFFATIAVRARGLVKQ